MRNNNFYSLSTSDTLKAGRRKTTPITIGSRIRNSTLATLSYSNTTARRHSSLRRFVGDSNEWRVPEVADFYYKWSEGKQFHVGDSLLFYYDYEVDDVLEISGDLEFKACDPNSPISVHNQGQDLITLTKPGIHYSISSKTVDCEAGLKLRVVVQPLPEVVPEKMNLSPLDRLIKWLQNFRPQPHH
ncbi:Phytocyanin domain [Arabidopsis suecica]|uniref:Phytocyanin domain n=1 Tax=Arabidopsis suecica TaxID=45249 RepID=A0A8T2BV72_ARASU|nr:Phytocyanin domain [Arabidopsis suecica]